MKNDSTYKDCIASITFSSFWNIYDKKVNRKMTEKKWHRLGIKVKQKILEHLGRYVASTPDKQYRKNPSTYLNQEAWNDEIIQKSVPNFYPNKKDYQGMQGFAWMEYKKLAKSNGWDYFSGPTGSGFKNNGRIIWL